LGNRLTDARRKAAARLVRQIESELSELGMEKARFTISFNPSDATISGIDLHASPSGADQVEFVVQTNPGQLAHPLRRIASGGEMSRIMLALKGILAGSDRVSVLVFDEIDANVGGRLGSVIGHKLRDLGMHHQVLCITHLPQIACFADRHLTVRKTMSGQATATSVQPLDRDARLQELAEMIGGAQVTPTTLAQVQELLDAVAPTGKADRRKRMITATPRQKKKGK
jgi:DNA repair protein RecN (Recombination protein N)